MKERELIERIADCLLMDGGNFTADTELSTLEGWDSVGRLGIIALFNEMFNMRIDTKKLVELKTVRDIVDIARGELEA